MRVMIDTNIFDEIINDYEIISNAILSGKISIYFTSIQRREIEQIKDETKRELLLGLMKRLEANIIPTSFSFSHVDFSHFSFSTGEIVSEIENGNIKNHFDALIADSAFINGLQLPSNKCLCTILIL